MWVQELEIAEKEGRRLRREEESKKVKDEEDAGPSGPPDGNGPAPMDTQMSGLDERQASLHSNLWRKATQELKHFSKEEKVLVAILSKER